MLTNEFVDSTIANMKVIAKVPQGGKLRVYKGQLSVEQDDRLQGVRRWSRSDSREVSLTHIKNTINNAISIVSTIKRSRGSSGSVSESAT